MPYNRSRAFSKRKRNRVRRKARYFRKRGSLAQASQIWKIDKRVRKLNKQLGYSRSWFNYYNEINQHVPYITGATGTYGYNAFPVLDTTRMTACFDVPNQADLAQDTWTYHGTNIHLRIDINTENTNPIRVTTYLVQLRKSTRATSLRNWGESLQYFFTPVLTDTDTPTSNNANPIMCFSSGQTYINTKAFKILAVRHATIGEVGYGSSSPPVRNIGDTVTEYHFRVNRRTVMARSQHDIIDALTDSRSTVNRDAQTYIIVVTNNSALDAGDLELTATMLHTFSAL